MSLALSVKHLTRDLRAFFSRDCFVFETMRTSYIYLSQPTPVSVGKSHTPFLRPVVWNAINAVSGAVVPVQRIGLQKEKKKGGLILV